MITDAEKKKLVGQLRYWSVGPVMTMRAASEFYQLKDGEHTVAAAMYLAVTCAIDDVDFERAISVARIFHEKIKEEGGIKKSEPTPG